MSHILFGISPGRTKCSFVLMPQRYLWCSIEPCYILPPRMDRSPPYLQVGTWWRGRTSRWGTSSGWNPPTGRSPTAPTCTTCARTASSRPPSAVSPAGGCGAWEVHVLRTSVGQRGRTGAEMLVVFRVNLHASLTLELSRFPACVPVSSVGVSSCPVSSFGLFLVGC